MTRVDSSHTEFGPKSLFDTTIIAGSNILHQRKILIVTKGVRETAAINFEIIRVNAQGDCELISYRVHNDFSVMNYSNYFSNDTLFKIFTSQDTSYRRKIRLEKRYDTFYYKGKPLFRHILNNFLDFYLRSEKS